MLTATSWGLGIASLSLVVPRFVIHFLVFVPLLVVHLACHPAVFLREVGHEPQCDTDSVQLTDALDLLATLCVNSTLRSGAPLVRARV